MNLRTVAAAMAVVAASLLLPAADARNPLWDIVRGRRHRGTPYIRHINNIYSKKTPYHEKTTLVRAENVKPDRPRAAAPDPPTSTAPAFPMPPDVSSFDGDPTRPRIFLGLAAYRDTLRCARTLHFAFTKATNADRVHIGIVQQIGGDDPDCVEEYCRAYAPDGAALCRRRAQVSEITVDAKDAKGPTWARFLQGDLIVGDEEFCMQLDSHSDFTPGWDVEMVKEWLATRNEHGILTTYIAGFEQRPTGPNSVEVPHCCNVMWGAHGIIRNQQATNAGNLRAPLLAPLWAAGLSFAKCHAAKAVPYDAHLWYTFDGEEFSRAARFWTRGYDFYSPSRNLVFHDYKPVPHRYDHHLKRQDRDRSRHNVQRMVHMMGFPALARRMGGGGDDYPKQELDVYGLGTIRSMADYLAFAGVDLENHKLVEHYERCNELEWVPWDWQNWVPETGR